MINIQRGEIYWVDLNPGHGSEINKIRPCVVMSTNPINRARRTVVVIPLSSSPQANPPITIPISFQDKNAVAVVDQIRAIDKTRLKQCAGALPQEQMIAIEDGLRQVLELPQ
ncbi:MAG TPA: type II toxin-antitoxin system PemK/MazF family toxin [Gammaproteobacteria bacterium]|nr:type II toxin-antitoxin system PemK/MazF family toxin [Gammaproteobacteria bacterium]HRA42135.1 type II toxin-antitoxin system PemK/MazF family toxin [Gammaproteobacteria bacterium]